MPSTNVVNNATNWLIESARLNEQYSYFLLEICVQNNMDNDTKKLASSALLCEVKDNYSKI